MEKRRQRRRLLYICTMLVAWKMWNARHSGWIPIPRNTDSMIKVQAFAIIPKSMGQIGSKAFQRRSSLQTLSIPNPVTAIEGSAFAGCSSLENVTIPNSVTKIGFFAFSGCSSLKSLTIPNSVTEIGYAAFGECSSLKSLIIPNSVTRIGFRAFEGCPLESLCHWCFQNLFCASCF